MHLTCLDPPESGDLADGPALVEPQPQQVETPHGIGSQQRTVGPLACGGLAHHRRRPLAVEHAAQPLLGVGRLVEEPRLLLLIAAAAVPALGSTRHVPDDAVKERPEPAGAVIVDTFQHAAVPEALHKDLLDDVVQFVEHRRAAPSRQQVRADDLLVPLGKQLPRVIVAGSRVADHRPTRRLSAQ